MKESDDGVTYWIHLKSKMKARQAGEQLGRPGAKSDTLKGLFDIIDWHSKTQ